VDGCQLERHLLVPLDWDNSPHFPSLCVEVSVKVPWAQCQASVNKK
jgi:hypothetical protein